MEQAERDGCGFVILRRIRIGGRTGRPSEEAGPRVRDVAARCRENKCRTDSRSGEEYPETELREQNRKSCRLCYVSRCSQATALHLQCRRRSVSSILQSETGGPRYAQEWGQR